jgi:hypothetical protein
MMLIRGCLWQSIVVSSCILLGMAWNVQVVISWDHEGGDECQSDLHCLNGGECMSATLVADFKHCHCRDGFSGPRCSDILCPLTCQNGGSCQRIVEGQFEGGSGFVRLDSKASSPSSNPGDFECKCHGYFVGPLCETSYINCGHYHRCFNGGVCVHDDDNNSNQSVRCSCLDGYDGEHCEVGVVVVQEGEQLKTNSKRKGRIAALVICGLITALAVIYAPTLIPNGTNGSLKFVIIQRTKKAFRVSTSISRKPCDGTKKSSDTTSETSYELT